MIHVIHPQISSAPDARPPVLPKSDNNARARVDRDAIPTYATMVPRTEREEVA